MLNAPEFESDFYEKQIELMESRYSRLFKNWGVKWDAYIKYVTAKLKNNRYWLWIFLCGFEKFIKEQSQESNGRRDRIYKDADIRIRMMIKDDLKFQEYMRSI
jgi:hypothetical protein